MDLNNLVLRPNCLLTKNPLIFLTGPRSLFFYESLGGDLPDFIAAHGYVVLKPYLPFRGKNRSLFLASWLKRQDSKVFHFILGPETQKEFLELFKNFPGSTFTLSNQFKDEFDNAKNIIPLKYRLHEIFSKFYGATPEAYASVFPDKSPLIYERILDHCIQLAENE